MKQIAIHSFLEKISPAVLALALSLHVFNMGGEGGVKPFHFAAISACMITLFNAGKNKDIVLIYLFLICVFVSAIISTVSSTVSGFIDLFVVSLCCYGVSIVNIDSLLKWFSILIPFDLLALSFEAITNPFYRFQGFYNDPNYLCTTLIVFFFLSILTYYKFESKILKIVSLTDIVIIVVLIIVTLSRTGLACIFLLLIVSFANTIKRNFLKGSFILLISAIAVNHYAADFIDQEYTLLYERLFERSDNLESARELRAELSKQNLKFISDNPSYLFFGLGPSATSGEHAKQILGLIHYRKSHHRDHNTWTSCLSEYGLFAFVFFLLLILGIIKRVLSQKNGIMSKYISWGILLSMIIFSLSIWQMTYLPFWWGLFLLSNKQLYQV